MTRARFRTGCFISTCLALLPVVSSAQTADTTITQGVVLREFVDPRAVAIDPQGSIFVVDASAATLVRLTDSGAVTAVHGGPGSGEYEFDTPTDVDVSAGLVWLIADAGNGRIKRFSSEFLHLGSIPVDLSSFVATQTAGAGGFRDEEGDPFRHAGGSPVAVASNLSGETFAIDANSGTVIKWDPTRRIERVFGRPGELRGALMEPVALAIDRDGRVFVADREQESVIVYDRFGTFMRRIADGLAKRLVGVSVADDRLLVVMEDRVAVYSLQGDLLRTYRLDLGEPLRDVSVANRAFIVLTERRLVRVPF